jgi:hypothetical protein
MAVIRAYDKMWRRIEIAVGQGGLVMPRFPVLCLAAMTLLGSPARAADYEGTAVVVDGDTIELHVGDKVISVRLCGIDAPESGHAGGREASAKMATLIDGKEVQCVQVGGGTPCDGRSKTYQSQTHGRSVLR